MNKQAPSVNVARIDMIAVNQIRTKANIAIVIGAAIIALCTFAFPLSNIHAQAEPVPADPNPNPNLMPPPPRPAGMKAEAGVRAGIRAEAKADAQGIRKDAAEDRRAILGGAKADAQNIRIERKADVDALRKAGIASSTKPGEVWKDILDVRAGARADLKENRLDAKGELQQNRINKVEALKENIEERKAAIDARRAELKAKLEAKKAERKNATSTPERQKKLDENAKKRVDQKMGDIYNRLNDRINGLTRVDAQISARLSAMPDEVDITAVSALLVTAQSALAKAKVDVEATKALAASETVGTTTKEALRTLVETAETSIKAAGTAYKAVLDAMKALSKPIMPAAAAAVEAEANPETPVQQ